MNERAEAIAEGWLAEDPHLDDDRPKGE